MIKKVLIKKILRKVKQKIHDRKIIFVIFALSVSIIVIFAGYFWSQQKWNSYKSNFNRSFDSAKMDINSILLQISDESYADKSKDINDIVNIKNRLSHEVQSYCQVDHLVEWQSSISTNENMIDDCERKKIRIDLLLGDLSKLTRYLMNEQKLSEIISAANTKTDQNNQTDKWSEVETAWRLAANDVSALSASAETDDINTIVADKLSGVADAWKLLCAANESEDEQQFEAARSAISSAYTSLAEISDSSKTQFDKLTAGFNASYKRFID